MLGARHNQLERTREDVDVSAADPLAAKPPSARLPKPGYGRAFESVWGYLNAWLAGNGAVAIDHLMEDAATVEIARSQIWQWLHHGPQLSDGQRISRSLVKAILDEEYQRWQQERPSATHLDQARELFTDAAMSPDYPTFTTIGAYERYLVTAK